MHCDDFRDDCEKCTGLVLPASGSTNASVQGWAVYDRSWAIEVSLENAGDHLQSANNDNGRKYILRPHWLSRLYYPAKRSNAADELLIAYP